SQKASPGGATGGHHIALVAKVFHILSWPGKGLEDPEADPFDVRLWSYPDFKNQRRLIAAFTAILQRVGRCEQESAPREVGAVRRQAPPPGEGRSRI
ncbi:MAG: hypothetical protein JW797_17005, partial [Bradymonadales bacterium]|nr:hypothetical protein [Bradymonadales bacterium]